MGLILLIDDEKIILRALSQIIEAMGHTVQTAVSGEEAVRLFRPGLFDLVVADLNLPDSTGLNLLKDFMEEDPEIKTVLITGFSTIQALAQATNEGVNAYITKPFSAADIISTLNRLIPTETGEHAEPSDEDDEEGLFSRIVKKWRPTV